MRLPFHPDALIELDQAVAWLERERAGFGSILFEEVVRKIEQASRFPRSGAPVLGFDARYDVRKLVVNRFRYVVITAMIEDELTVIAVAHTSRAPGYWRDRLL
jgi:toxin ParE1/3/4